MQEMIDNYEDLNKKINLSNKKILLVCDNFLLNSFIYDYLKKCTSSLYVFTDFNPNPKYEEVLEGIKIFKNGGNKNWEEEVITKKEEKKE